MTEPPWIACEKQLPPEGEVVATQSRWYMDCYSWEAVGGIDFPVNSYYHESLSQIAKKACQVLESELAGIDEVRISRATQGLSPRQIAE